MAKETIEILIEGGKATAAPPLGPALGPLGVNIGQIVSEINKKTASFKGMQVPVKVEVDTETKDFTITLGTPPASALIKKELNLDKGSGNPKKDLVGNMTVEQLKKITEMKADSLLGKTLKEKSKEIAGTARSMGITIEGKRVEEFMKELNEGKYDNILGE